MCAESVEQLETTATDVTENEANRNGIIEIFQGENGPIYAGMIGIVLIAAIGLFSKGRYKVNVSNSDTVVSLEPS